MSKSKTIRSKHNKRLTQILNSEIKQEIKGIQVIAKETQFWRGNKLVAEPDGLIWNGKELYIMEYKCNKNNIDRAYEQLDNAQKFIENELGIYVPFKHIIKCD
jgi:hypothetical protein